VSVTRADIIAAALSWLGTPFHDGACVKGAGVDCANFLIGAVSDAGLIERFKPDPYTPQWFLHRGEPIFLETLARYAHEIPKESVEAADIIMYKFGRQAAHGAIVIDAHTIIHAFKYAGCVCRSDRRQFASRAHSYWSVF